MLKIGELSRQTNVPQDTLRFYEQKGLLNPKNRSQAGYRLYDNADVKTLQFILSAKAVGFTLKEIHELLQLEVTKDSQSCEDVKQVVDQKISVIDKRIEEMCRIKKSLSILSDACCGGDEPATSCTILEALRDSDEADNKHEVNKSQDVSHAATK